MLAGAVAALASRDEALTTMQTLQADLVRKRARAEALHNQGHRQAVRIMILLYVFARCLHGFNDTYLPPGAQARRCAAEAAGTSR